MGSDGNVSSGRASFSIIDVCVGSTVSRKKQKQRIRKSDRHPAKSVKPVARGRRGGILIWVPAWGCLLALTLRFG